MFLSRSLRRPLGQRARWKSSSHAPKVDVAAILAEPTWSVQSLLPDANDATARPEVSPSQLRHLLRLSALPEPANEAEETELLKTLQSQIHFVKEIQKVDTTGVKPLSAIRDETWEAQEENTIHMDDLEEAFAKEQKIGRNGRIKRDKSQAPRTSPAEQWDPLAHASGKIGRYFVVRTPKDREEKVSLRPPILEILNGPRDKR